MVHMWWQDPVTAVWLIIFYMNFIDRFIDEVGPFHISSPSRWQTSCYIKGVGLLSSIRKGPRVRNRYLQRRTHIYFGRLWASWRLKSPATGVFAYSNIKENIKLSDWWPFVRGILRLVVVLTQSQYNAESVSMSWRQDGIKAWLSGMTDVSILCRPSHMMTSSNGNIFRVTGHLCGEFTGPRWIPRTKASDTELWCFLWYAPE